MAKQVIDPLASLVSQGNKSGWFHRFTADAHELVNQERARLQLGPPIDWSKPNDKPSRSGDQFRGSWHSDIPREELKRRRLATMEHNRAKIAGLVRRIRPRVQQQRLERGLGIAAAAAEIGIKVEYLKRFEAWQIDCPMPSQLRKILMWIGEPVSGRVPKERSNGRR